jgi:hypothetical protein
VEKAAKETKSKSFNFIPKYTINFKRKKHIKKTKFFISRANKELKKKLIAKLNCIQEFQTKDLGKEGKNTKFAN